MRILATTALLIFGSSAYGAELPRGFARLADVAPAAKQEMRYAGPHNFTGRLVPGYGKAECWLRADVARALAKVAASLAAGGWRLVVYDCYRPARATAAFVRWAGDASDQGTKTQYYPRVEKHQLFALGYIARASSHSKGMAVDAGAEQSDGTPLDFGTPFDMFDSRSAGASREVSTTAQANRARLAAAFRAQGFAPYGREWWHFGFGGGGAAYDVPIGP